MSSNEIPPRSTLSSRRLSRYLRLLPVQIARIARIGAKLFRAALRQCREPGETAHNDGQGTFSLPARSSTERQRPSVAGTIPSRSIAAAGRPSWRARSIASRRVV